jgi:hypothetical protein
MFRSENHGNKDGGAEAENNFRVRVHKMSPSFGWSVQLRVIWPIICGFRGSVILDCCVFKDTLSSYKHPISMILSRLFKWRKSYRNRMIQSQFEDSILKVREQRGKSENGIKEWNFWST